MALALAEVSLQAQDDVLMRAMHDEMERSMEQLRLAPMPGPYFVAYWVREESSLKVTGSLGGVVARGQRTGRSLSVEVRVGDYELDNSNFFAQGEFWSGIASLAFTALPLGDDYHELRRKIWLATDGAYKAALNQLSQKRAALQHQTRVEAVADFSREDPVEFHDDRLPPDLADAAAVEALVRDLSAGFKRHAPLHASQVHANLSNRTTYFVNSEGSSYVRQDPAASLRVVAGVQASDGTELDDFFAAYGESWADIPDAPALEERIEELAARMLRRLDGSIVERYNGPVLFTGQAAGELVSQVLAPRLLGLRPPATDDSIITTIFHEAHNPFVDKLGARVLPRFLDVIDDPTVEQHDGRPLLGGYDVDDDGVSPRRTIVIERGRLNTLLTTRIPVAGVPNSSGNRRNMGPAPSNLLVQVRNGMAPDAIRQELMDLVQERDLEYGIIVRRIGHPLIGLFRDLGSGIRVPTPLDVTQTEAISEVTEAYKVFPDGREELIRRLEISGLSESSFRDIVAASDDSSVHHTAFKRGDLRSPAFLTAFGGPGHEAPVVSLVVPELLFEDLSLRRSRTIPRPPMLDPPAIEN